MKASTPKACGAANKIAGGRCGPPAIFDPTGPVRESTVFIRKANTPEEIRRAVDIDAALPGDPDRTAYIERIAAQGNLTVAGQTTEITAFCCLDHGYFFEKPFVSLLIVAPEARRFGLGAALLADCASRQKELWTSTNRSNRPMRALLEKTGWRYCGEVSGLDEGDPERFYRIG